jgi:signal transduction histidine kinase
VIRTVAEHALEYFPPLGIDIQIFDESPGAVQRVLYVRQPAGETSADSTEAVEAGGTDGIRHRADLHVPGRLWSIQCTPTEEYLADRRSRVPLAALLTGLAITALLSTYVSSLIGWTGTLEARVQERTAELARSNAELARSNTDLEQFAYVASHDLQEPLRMVAGYVQLLARRYEGKLDRDADEYIGFAVDGVKRMQQLIDGLLAYSRVGRRGRAPVPVDCNEAIRQAIGNLEAAIAQQGAEVTCDPLPTVQADRAQLVQVFQNLLGNAIKFRGPEPPHVHVDAQRSGEAWLFRVRDNGIGIDPKEAGRLFTLFYRLHSQAEYPGTGIGLATCKRIVERHGGRIWFDSEPGQGTTFQFTLPDSLPGQ